VTAPDTGSGGYADDGNDITVMAIAIALAAAAIAATGGAALAWKRR
jgi:hypothetical protein